MLGLLILLIREDDIRNIEHIKKENIKYIESLDSNIKMEFTFSNNKKKYGAYNIWNRCWWRRSGRDFCACGSSEEFIYILEGELSICQQIKNINYQKETAYTLNLV